MAVGYYIALSFMNKVTILALGAFGFAFLTWVGSGADLLCLLREWYKDKREQETIPSLVFNGFYKKKSESGFRQEEQYFVKVSREGGEGEAEGVTGHVGVIDRLELKDAAWHGNGRKVNIITIKYLLLFNTFEHKGKVHIGLYGMVLDPNKPDFEIKLENSLYENYKKDRLIVEIYSERGRIKKKRLEKKIEDIVKEAKEIPP